MTQERIVSDPKEASVGAYQAIEKIEGVLEPGTIVDNRFDPKKRQIEIKLTDAVILQVKQGEPEPELKDDTWRCWMSYPPVGRKPSNLSFYMGAFCTSGNLLAKSRGIQHADETTGLMVDGTWQDLVKTRVQLVHVKDQPLGTIVDKDTKEKKPVTGSGYIFDTGDGKASSEGLDEYVTNLIIGQTPSAAIRLVLMDARAKRDDKFKTALQNNTIGEILKVKLGEDNKFVGV